MVRYRGYRSRAFVTFGQPIARRIDSNRAVRCSTCRTVMATIGRLTQVRPRCCRDTAVDPRRELEHGPTRSRHARATGANLVCRAGPGRGPDHQPLEARGIVAVPGAVRVRAQRAALLSADSTTCSRLRRATRIDGRVVIDAVQKSFFNLLSQSALLKRMASRYGMASPNSFARRFIAGETVQEAIEVARTLQSKGFDLTLDYLGESVRTHQEADAAARDKSTWSTCS
jgi:hypothetical protein